MQNIYATARKHNFRRKSGSGFLKRNMLNKILSLQIEKFTNFSNVSTHRHVDKCLPLKHYDVEVYSHQKITFPVLKINVKSFSISYMSNSEIDISMNY